MLTKSHWNVKDGQVRLDLPIMKVDKQRRLVSGFATLDNVDKHGDVITVDASRKAFATWRGNLREMHAPIAVGKVVDFKEEEFFDATDQKTYNGIFVTAYVSEGAEDTWKKVLDGTLSGFSIGGKVIKRSVHMDDKAEIEYRQIDEYELAELSLVDSPANQFANVVSIQKSDVGTQFSGIAVDTKTQNVLYCRECSSAVITNSESRECDAHGAMVNIGWVEDTAKKADRVKDLVAQFRKDDFRKSLTELVGEEVDLSKFDAYIEPKITVTKHDEGGAKMAENNDNNESKERVVSEQNMEEGARRVEHENPPAVTASEEENTGGVEESREAQDERHGEDDDDEEGTTKAADVSEVSTSDGVDLDQLTKAITDKVIDAVKSVKTESDEAVAGVKSSLDDALASLKKEIETSFGEISGKIDNLGGRVSTLEDGTAVKKSADVRTTDDEEETQDESFWRGQFLSTNDLVK